MQVLLYRMNKFVSVFRNIYVYTCVYITKTNKKKSGPDFEREQGQMYGSVWRKERNGK